MYSPMLSHTQKNKKIEFYAVIRAFKKNKKMKNKVICIFISSFSKQEWKIYIFYMHFHHTFIYASL